MESVQKTAREDEAVFGVESTGHYWLVLYAHLRQAGYTVHIINTIQADALHELCPTISHCTLLRI